MENTNEMLWGIYGLDSSRMTLVKNPDGTCNILYKVSVDKAESISFKTTPIVSPVTNETPTANTETNETVDPINEEPEPVVVPPVVEPEPVEEPEPEPINEPEPEPIEEPAPEPVEEPAPANNYIVWVKDVLWGKDYEVSGDEWTWTRPTEHAYDVYVEGPASVKVYPEIERLGKIYTSKEDLTSRGPKIGFNRIQNIPQTLKGEGVKVLIGTNIGPGSSSAKGYDGYLRFRTEAGEIIKEIRMRFI